MYVQLYICIGGIDLDIGALQDQVSTLTQALSTVMEEKSKMEMSFQQDKKNLLVSLNEVMNGWMDGWMVR